jgi:subtilisin family serine protease
VKRTAIALACVAAGFALNAASAAAATSTPNDPFFAQGSQWGLKGSAGAINAPGAWPIATGSGVVVGDVDTGADFGNPDLQGKLIPGAQFLACPGAGAGSLISDSPSGTGQDAVQDDVGHGSMTTGIAVAGTNNGQGIAAVAPDAKALIVKVLSRTIAYDSSNKPQYAYGSGCTNDIGAGIQFAVDHGAQVINLSIGSEVPLTGSVGDITDAITYAWNHDVAVAVAAGNNQLPVSDYSTIQSQALVVGALGPGGGVAAYSTKNVGVNLYAPGGDSASGGSDIQHLVVSTSWPDPQFGGGRYAIGEGTSFAAPHAAGVLALLRSCGLGGQAAVQRVKSVAANHGNHLDAAATLAGYSHCAGASGQQASSGGQQAGSGSQGSSAGGAAAGSAAGAGGPASTAKPSSGVAAATSTPSPQPDTATGGSGGTSAQPPTAVSGAAPRGGGGSPNALLLALLAGVVVIGAPAAAWLVRAMRPPAAP